jgi:hypothetical protein
MGTLAVTPGDYIGARNALASEDVAVIEGIATDFRPMPYEGHANEINSADRRVWLVGVERTLNQRSTPIHRDVT